LGLSIPGGGGAVCRRHDLLPCLNGGRPDRIERIDPLDRATHLTAARPDEGIPWFVAFPSRSELPFPRDGGVGAVIIRLAIMVAVCQIVAAVPTQASRSCLDKSQAVRTWPARQLVKDEDGCWTYRRETKPPLIEQAAVPPRAPDPPPAADMREWANAMAAMPVPVPVAVTPWVDRWPNVHTIELNKPPPIAETKTPLLSVRTVILTITVLVLCVALIEVAFGGMIEQRKLNRRDGYFT
jgi:hypothetical protein